MKPKQPTKTGFYWALWLTAAPGTHEGDELTPAREWEVVQVWENFIGEPCEADAAEKFAVSVPGVREMQWLENFKWGEAVTHYGEAVDLRKPLADLYEIASTIGSHGPCRNLNCPDCKAVLKRAKNALQTVAYCEK